MLDPCGGSCALALVDESEGPPLCRRDLVHARFWAPESRVPLAVALGSNAIERHWLDGADEWLRPSLVLMRPPLNGELEYVKRAWDVQGPHGGKTAALVPLDLLARERWHAWLVDHVPAVYVVPESEGIGPRPLAWLVWARTVLSEARAPGKKAKGKASGIKSAARVPPKAGTLHMLRVE